MPSAAPDASRPLLPLPRARKGPRSRWRVTAAVALTLTAIGATVTIHTTSEAQAARHHTELDIIRTDTTAMRQHVAHLTDQARTVIAHHDDRVSHLAQAIDDAKAVQAGTPQGGDALTSLTAAIDAASATIDPAVTDLTTTEIDAAIERLPQASAAAVVAQEAWRKAEDERIVREAAEQAARASAARAAANSAPSPGRPAANSNPDRAAAGSLEQQVEEVLRNLPGNDGTWISWNDPELAGHLGAVWIGAGGDASNRIMVNSERLAGNTSKAKDVVRHEIGHVYQDRLISQHGYDEIKGRLDEAFGGNGIERSADCVALRFGASWVNYGRQCGSSAQQGWVDGLIGGYVP